jgi:hypothetical protein
LKNYWKWRKPQMQLVLVAPSETGTTYPSGAPAFALVCLLFLVGFVFFNVVKLHVFTWQTTIYKN